VNAVWLVIGAVIVFVLAYIFYGNFVAKRLGIDPERKTPAHTCYDGMDYVPTRAPILLGHHFASIAGASPIIGPITAAVFGWVPVLLWLVAGGIFMGAVHDFASLVASVRHQGLSIGEVIEKRIGRKGKQLFLVFSFFTLVLVISSFLIIIAKTFVESPSSGTPSLLFIVLAVGFGWFNRKFSKALLLTSTVGVILVFFCVYLGLVFPLKLSFDVWILILLVYIFIAATAPVWILLQPRGYLNSFLLYALIFAGLLGIMFVRPVIKLEAFTGFNQDIGYLFPILFVTVACGAISGFHSLIASGTTSKQLNSEKDAKLIGYGGMLIESALGVLALVTAAILTKSDYKNLMLSGPITLFSEEIGNFMTSFGFTLSTGKTFAALAVSAFALTTLDTATRICRYTFQEFFRPKITGESPNLLYKNRYIGTFISVVVAAVLAYSGKWELLWPLFGSANQMLAAIALLAVSVWLAVRGIKNGFTLIPMFFMFAITITALVVIIWKTLFQKQFVLTLFGITLLIVVILLIILAFKRIFISKKRDYLQSNG
jgi:carbon starvation protein